MKTLRSSFLVVAAWGFSVGCSFAPKYNRPAVATPTAYKELTSTNAAWTNLWKVAEPGDAMSRGKWWEMFNDPELNALEEQVSISNQNVAAAFANFFAARALVKQARAQLYPTVTTDPSVTRSRQQFLGISSNTGRSGTTFTEYALPLDASWQLDLWGRIRNTIKANSLEAQATAGDLENTRLAAEGDLATDYFELRAQDSLQELFDDTVAAYRESLRLTQVRFQTGIASDEDVALAETQLQTAQAQATNLRILRAQLEHAIAMLIGKPASNFSLPVGPLHTAPPPTPIGLPSQLLERRPDVAAAERRVAEANAQIGVARAAYFPTVTLTASGGFQTIMWENLMDWASRVWSLGASLSEVIFDAGLRKATVEQYWAVYQGDVAKYREAVLTAFQQVEDDLAALRILEQEVREQDAAVAASEKYLNLANDRYKLGIDSYLNVIIAQTSLLSNRQTLVNLHKQLITSSVQLVQALGGGWDVAQLPSPRQVLSGKASSGNGF